MSVIEVDFAIGLFLSAESKPQGIILISNTKVASEAPEANKLGYVDQMVQMTIFLKNWK